jgi:hypothetical protein
MLSRFRPNPERVFAALSNPVLSLFGGGHKLIRFRRKLQIRIARRRFVPVLFLFPLGHPACRRRLDSGATQS